MAFIPKSDPHMTILPPRGRGRPRASEPSTTVCTWMEARHYDQLVKMATEQEKSVSALVKDLVLVSLLDK